MLGTKVGHGEIRRKSERGGKKEQKEGFHLGEKKTEDPLERKKTCLSIHSGVLSLADVSTRPSL